MTKLIRFFFTAALLSTAASFSGTLSANDRPKILIYGSNGCGFCNAMRKSLNKDKIHFTFYDVNSNNAKNSEMWKKVRTLNPKAASTKFPVMDINGKIMIRPTYKQVKALVSKT